MRAQQERVSDGWMMGGQVSQRWWGGFNPQLGWLLLENDPRQEAAAVC